MVEFEDEIDQVGTGAGGAELLPASNVTLVEGTSGILYASTRTYDPGLGRDVDVLNPEPVGYTYPNED